jgi:hypothetical protein
MIFVPPTMFTPRWSPDVSGIPSGWTRVNAE